MVKVISSSNAAPSCRLHWDLQAEAEGGFMSDGAIPVRSSRYSCRNSISAASKCEQKAGYFFQMFFPDALHSSFSVLLNQKRNVLPVYRRVQHKIPNSSRSKLNWISDWGLGSFQLSCEDGGHIHDKKRFVHKGRDGGGYVLSFLRRYHP